MRLSISGIAPDKKRRTVTWVNGTVKSDEFLKTLYDSLAKDLETKNISHHPTAISNSPKGVFSMSAFFYISRFILKDVKIEEGIIAPEDFLRKGAKA